MITINAPAKINLGLHVVGQREDGYHTIETLFQAVDLCDELHLSPAESGVSLRVEGIDLDGGEGNLVHRAATRLLDTASCHKGVAVRLVKRIPVGAGLGGGSSDAAATLKGLVDLYNIPLSTGALVELASSLGADVPFFLNGPTAFGRGIGDILESAPPLPPFWVVIVKPDFPIATGWVYQEYDSGLTKTGNKIKILKSAVASGDAWRIGESLFNDLESICFKRFPVLAEIKKGLLTLGACGALMSGSGSSVFGLFIDSGEARRACRSIIKCGREDREVFLCRTILK
ncbi:MAG: 4-(cytidine 5'-diphospho)-2-C-methyl-D-erythritol kinase [bacterium]